MAAQQRLEATFPKATDVPERFRVAEPLVQRTYLVNGQLHRWDGPMQQVFSPVCIASEGDCTPTELGSYPLMSEAQATDALDAAVAAYGNGRGEWPTMPVEQRIRHLEHFAYRMKERREEVVRLLMWEICKSLPDAEKEFDRTVDYIRDTIMALKDLDRIDSRFTIQQGIIAQIRRAPLGVVLCMGPFNYPLNETFTTLIPALVMGNTVIFKPPKLGVLLHQPLLEAFRDAFPPGVVNTVYGEGQKVIAPLMASGLVDALAFIGSSRVANILKKQHPTPHRLRTILGLEAKNAGIVLKDADLDATVKECLLGTLSYNGQRCTALKILFVHKSIAEAFLSKFVDGVKKLKIGMPWDAGVQITPLAEPDKPAQLWSLVEDATQRGAQIVNPQGGTHARTLFQPAVVYPVKPGMKLYTVEQFGPVIPIATFDDINEPIDYVATSNYGQQVSVFGSDPDQIARLIDPLVNQVCRVNINAQCQRGPDTLPFTGRKDSAEGTLSVSDALKVFSIRTLVATKENALNKSIVTEIVRERKSNFLATDYIL